MYIHISIDTSDIHGQSVQYIIINLLLQEQTCRIAFLHLFSNISQQFVPQNTLKLVMAMGCLLYGTPLACA